MNSASVGFQCPDCVREGKRTTRQPQGAYGGLRVTDASLTTIVLIVLNVVVFAIINLTGRYGSPLLRLFALEPVGRCEVGGDGYLTRVTDEQTCTLAQSQFPSAHWVHGVSDGAYWQLLTNAFTHVEIWHIAANMLALWIIGPQVEQILGRARFLALYLISALAGSVLVYLVASPTTQTVGASGAIFGLFGALLVIARKVRAPLRPIVIILVINAAITFSVPGISWQGHVGGFVGGVIVAGVLAYTPRGPHRGRLQLAGLSAFTAVLLALAVVRTAALT
jgi:membrane associated rhomboid family serine protease